MAGLLAPASQPSRFLALPAEIRVSIYEFLFSGSWIEVAIKETYPWNWRNICRITHCTEHQILLTCWHCYLEARNLWYASTMWDFNSLTVRPFLDATNVRPYVASIRYVNLRDVHDLTQLWPGLLPSLRYVVARVPNHLPWLGKTAFGDMDTEGTIRTVKNRTFGEKSVKSRICDYLYHDGVGQKLPRKKNFCLHFFTTINQGWRNIQTGDLQGHFNHVTWKFSVDLDTDTVKKHRVGPVLSGSYMYLHWRHKDNI
jgi:hypothetical protein